MDNRAIGVFDSGLGGLTVFKEITEHLPGESVIYFGDNGRAPYGTKSRDTVIKYTLQDIRFLLNHDIKMIVIACNTMSAYYETVKKSFDIPVIEVIGPGAVTAVSETKNRRVGVIGTPATVNSGAYEKAINKLDNDIEIYQKACPMFVPLVEEGQDWWENDIAMRIAEEYLNPMKKTGVDTLVLGCTHYPLLHKTISKVMGEGVKLVNSALEVARVVKNTILENNMQRDARYKPVYRYYTSDSVEKFEPLCSAILGKAVHSAEKVDIEKY
ncbi:MAG TPA: glutamate racemase [Clostridia bacterium]|nr:glutamate racemase [Clostridia bacterium]